MIGRPVSSLPFWGPSYRSSLHQLPLGQCLQAFLDQGRLHRHRCCRVSNLMLKPPWPFLIGLDFSLDDRRTSFTINHQTAQGLPTISSSSKVFDLSFLRFKDTGTICKFTEGKVNRAYSFLGVLQGKPRNFKHMKDVYTRTEREQILGKKKKDF